MARKFRFRLEVVRKLREQARDEQRLVVAEVIRAVRSVEGRMEQLTDQLRETVHRTRDAREERRLDLPSLRGHQFYQGWLHRRIMETHENLAVSKARLDAERVRLGEATMRLKAIETLRERRWKRHQTLVHREEQAVGDEAAVRALASGRPRMGEGTPT